MSNLIQSTSQSVLGNLFGGSNRILVIALGVLIILIAIALLIASRAPAALRLVGGLPVPVARAARVAGAAAQTVTGTGS